MHFLSGILLMNESWSELYGIIARFNFFVRIRIIFVLDNDLHHANSIWHLDFKNKMLFLNWIKEKFLFITTAGNMWYNIEIEEMTRKCTHKLN